MQACTWNSLGEWYGEPSAAIVIIALSGVLSMGGWDSLGEWDGDPTTATVIIALRRVLSMGDSQCKLAPGTPLGSEWYGERSTATVIIALSGVLSMGPGTPLGSGMGSPLLLLSSLPLGCYPWVVANASAHLELPWGVEWGTLYCCYHCPEMGVIHEW